MNSNFFLSIGVALVFTFGALSAFYSGEKVSPQKPEATKELVMHSK